MTDDDYLATVLNGDDTSGEAGDAAWRAVTALRRRAEQVEADVAVLERVNDDLDRLVRMQNDQLREARRAVQRVRDRHPICINVPLAEGGCRASEHTLDDPPICFRCRGKWPCDTIFALDGDGDE